MLFAAYLPKSPVKSEQARVFETVGRRYLISAPPGLLQARDLPVCYKFTSSSPARRSTCISKQSTHYELAAMPHGGWRAQAGPGQRRAQQQHEEINSLRGSVWRRRFATARNRNMPAQWKFTAAESRVAQGMQGAAAGGYWQWRCIAKRECTCK